MKNEQKRVILTSNYSPWSPYSGGGQRSTHFIANELAKKGFDVHVIFAKTYFERIEIQKKLSYTIHWVSFPGFRSSRKNAFRLLSTIGIRNKVKELLTPTCAVHCNGEEGALIPQLKKRYSFKFIVTPRYPNIPPEADSFSPSFIDAVVHPYFSKYILLHTLLQRCDVFCPTSASSLNELRNKFELDQKKARVISNGVPQIFLDAGKNRSYTFEKIRIIYFGRLSESKGIDILLESVSLIKDKVDELIIIGRGEQKNIIQEANSSDKLSGKITLKDWMESSELVNEISKSTFAVLPSREESFGNAIAEAMACGLPVISSHAGSIPEIVENGNSGILIESEEARDYADALLQLMNNPDLSEEIGRNAYTRIKENYGWSSTAEKYIEIYGLSNSDN